MISLSGEHTGLVRTSFGGKVLAVIRDEKQVLGACLPTSLKLLRKKGFSFQVINVGQDWRRPKIEIDNAARSEVKSSFLKQIQPLYKVAQGSPIQTCSKGILSNSVWTYLQSSTPQSEYDVYCPRHRCSSRLEDAACWWPWTTVTKYIHKPNHLFGLSLPLSCPLCNAEGPCLYLSVSSGGLPPSRSILLALGHFFSF